MIGVNQEDVHHTEIAMIKPVKHDNMVIWLSEEVTLVLRVNSFVLMVIM